MSAYKIYLFYIKAQGVKEYYLTSANVIITHEGNTYLPYSGLSLISGIFNDSAENHIILHGVFEKYGISKDDKLVGSNIKIMYLQNDEIKHLVTYICTQYNVNDLDFEMRCEPETIKYGQSLLQMFSKTCRAKFGDNKCMINIEDYVINCDLLSHNVNLLICDIQDVEDGLFKGGKLRTEDHREFKILTHNGNYIEIDSALELDFSGYKRVTLVPACDKKFRTCCYSFNNAVNFRGEPAIPESNIVKS
ncbi:MAG: phage BR0599 family protein [Rickettsiaceae bacterium]|nr:phage BR0599 family protein [Rickettsiaceae bacterium]MDP4832150.1 phage BR0599 family protein [Rickettsiaceae bacterium]MDP5020346.1 phage BR0599 family protein [Rickettsiaceae bacterium]MDP5082838.1 phage BR0599 family protein [Rickettsiaceae bacterium]